MSRSSARFLLFSVLLGATAFTNALAMPSWSPTGASVDPSPLWVVEFDPVTGREDRKCLPPSAAVERHPGFRGRSAVPDAGALAASPTVSSSTESMAPGALGPLPPFPSRSVTWIETDLGQCAGIMVDHFLVATSAECLYDRTTRRWATAAIVVPGQSEIVEPQYTAERGGASSWLAGYRDRPWGAARSTRLRVVGGWIESGDPASNLGFITLDREIGTWTGHMSVEGGATYWVATALSAASYQTGGFDWCREEDRGLPGFDTWSSVSYTYPTVSGTCPMFGCPLLRSGTPIWRTDSGGYEHLQAIGRNAACQGTLFSPALVLSIDTLIADDRRQYPPLILANPIEYQHEPGKKSVSPTTVAAGGSVQVTGNVYNAGFNFTGAVTLDFYLTAATTGDAYGAPRIPLGSRTTGNVEPDHHALVTASFTVPAQVPPGDYFVLWKMASEYPSHASIGHERMALITSPVLTVTAPTALPDLVPENIHFVDQAGNAANPPLAGEAVYFGFDVVNRGSASTSVTQIAIQDYRDGSLGRSGVASIGILAPGQKQTGGFFSSQPWVVTAGDHVFRLVIDSTNLHTESNEVNNDASFAFSVAPLGSTYFSGWSLVQNSPADPLLYGWHETLDPSWWSEPPAGSRRGFLVLHPVSETRPAIVRWKGSLSPAQDALVVTVAGWASGDFLFRCRVNGQAVLERVLDSTGWTDVRVDLAPWRGQSVTIDLEDAAGGADPWHFEGAAIDDVVFVGSTCSAPTITTQPASASVPAGQPATLAVVASGTTPLSYQWYRGTSPDTSSPVAGATSASFTTPPVTAPASYWVRVGNACGSAPSSTATVTVASTTCTESAQVMCLLGGRYEVTCRWRNQYAGGLEATLNKVRLTDTTGAFWIADASTLETMVRLQAPTPNGMTWVVIPAFTDVEFWIRITDTSRAQTNEYHSAPGNRTLLFDPGTFPTDPRACTYTLSSTGASQPATATASRTFQVQAAIGCTYTDWTASSSVSWITVTGGASGRGPGTVTYAVAANPGVARVGTILAAGQTFTVTQDAAGGRARTSEIGK